jgi:hypothetical protein
MIKSRRMIWAGHRVYMVEKRNVNRIFGGKGEGKRLQRRPQQRWEENIKTELREIVWGGTDWIHLGQNRDHRRALVSIVTNLRLP